MILSGHLERGQDAVVLQVGQDLMRPFGLDDDDIELNYILDRNFETSFAIVNRLQTAECEFRHPTLDFAGGARVHSW